VANDAPDYVQPVKIETGEVIINPGSSPIPITPSSGSTFDISGPVTIESAETTLQVDTSSTPYWGTGALYVGTNLSCTGSSIKVGSFDVSKYSSLQVSILPSGTSVKLTLSFSVPGLSGQYVGQHILRLYDGLSQAYLVPVLAPTVDVSYQGVNGHTLSWLVLYGSTVVVPALGTPPIQPINKYAALTINAGSSGGIALPCYIGHVVITAYGTASQSTQVTLQEQEWDGTVVKYLMNTTVTLGWQWWDLALGPWAYYLELVNKGSTSNTISICINAG
jgi:hypothetical protein